MARNALYIGLIVYLIVINIVTFFVFALDKNNASKGKWRVREATLLELSIIGGSIGGLASMHIFRHKTQKLKFKIGMPLIFVIQCAIAIYLALNVL